MSFLFLFAILLVACGQNEKVEPLAVEQSIEQQVDGKSTDEEAINSIEYLIEQAELGHHFSLAAPIGLDGEDASEYLDMDHLKRLSQDELDQLIDHSAIVYFLTSKGLGNLLHDVERGTLLTTNFIENNVATVQDEFSQFTWDGSRPKSVSMDRNFTCTGWHSHGYFSPCNACGPCQGYNCAWRDGKKYFYVERYRDCCLTSNSNACWREREFHMTSHGCGVCTVFN